MSVGRICTRDVDLAAIDESVFDAAGRMRDRGVGMLIVVDANGWPAGVLTDRDLALRVVAAGNDPHATTVGAVMTKDPKTVSDVTPIGSALGLMRSGAFRRLPVVNGNGKLVGVLSLDDVIALLAEEFMLIAGVLEREAPHPAADGITLARTGDAAGGRR
jgi:CBS domain-containing protein